MPHPPGGDQQAGADQFQAELDACRRASATLREAAENFAGALAHDLKNPLAAIKVNVQALQRRLDRREAFDPAYWQERLARIEGAVEEQLRILADARQRLMDTAMPPETLRPQPLDLVALAKEVVSRYMEARALHLELESEYAELAGTWDAARLRRVLHELLDNAIRFSPQKSAISLHLRAREGPAGREALVTVADRGIGIPPADLPYIFERFYRGDNVVGRFQGAGLGLHQCKRDIDLHGGRIEVQTELDRGSAFTIYLPMQAG